MEDSVDIAVLFYMYRRLKRKRRRRWSVHPLNTLRPSLGEHIKIQKMYDSYPELFFQYTRMTPSTFDTLLNLIAPKISKQDTNYRQAIPARDRLIVTLRYLATGDSITTIATSFSMGKSTVWCVIQEVLDVIWEVLSPNYLKFPSQEDWLRIVKDFEDKWQFPNCFGAVDGKHVVIAAPPNSGSLYHNYKGSFSIVLLATCDADYNFTFVDIGAYGRQSDGGIFQNSALGRGLLQGSIDIPGDRRIPNTNLVQPCTLVGDEAFALSDFMMRPYSGVVKDARKRIFNYRLSRARRIIENTFGIMVSRYRIFQRRLYADDTQVKRIVRGTTVLHNFVRHQEKGLQPTGRMYCPPGYVDSEDERNGGWRTEMSGELILTPVKLSSSHNAVNSAKQMRDNLADHFISENGKVAWQDEKAALLPGYNTY